MRPVLLGITLCAGLALCQQPATTRPETVQAAQPGGAVNINTADVKELSQLPGVSRGTAKKIVAHRPYAKVEDLRRAGVPQDTIDKIRPLVNAAGTDAGIARHAEKAAKKQ